MSTWQKFEVRQAGRRRARKDLTALQKRLRRAWIALGAGSLAAALVSAAAPDPSVVQTCSDLGGECLRFGAPRHAERIPQTAICVPGSSASDAPRRGYRASIDLADGTPVHVLRTSSIAMTIAEADAVTTASPANGALSLSLVPTSTWVTAGMPEADAWLDARDASHISEVLRSGDAGLLPAAAFVRPGRDGSASPEERPADLVAETRHRGPLSGLARDDGGQSPRSHAAPEGYAPAQLGDDQVVLEDLRSQFRNLREITTPFTVAEGPLAGVALLTVVDRDRDGTSEREIVEVRVVHAAIEERAPEAASLGRNPGEESASARVTTVRLSVSTPTRQTLRELVGAWENQARSGTIHLPPNLLDPAHGATGDHLQDFLYQNAAVTIEKRGSSRLVADAGTLADVGPLESGGHESTGSALRLMQRSDDGVRRVYQELTCA